MTLAELRQDALDRYGLIGFGSEDPKFHKTLMDRCINRAHRYIAEQTRCYWVERTADITSGEGSIALGTDVFEVEPDTVRITDGSQWRDVQQRDMRELIQRYGGVLDNQPTGMPAYFYFRTGSAASAQMILKLFPRPNFSVSPGLRYGAFIWPAALSAETDEPALQSGLQDYFGPVICRFMAEIEHGQGRPDVPLPYWRTESERAVEEIKRITTRHRNPGPRRVRIDRYNEGWDGFW